MAEPTAANLNRLCGIFGPFAGTQIAYKEAHEEAMTDPRIAAGKAAAHPDRELCACGHPLHAIPCPDTSGDDGEGHVTICGCHRLVSDKLTAPPTRPTSWLISGRDYAKRVVSASSAYKVMDAQDARIKKLQKTLLEAICDFPYSCQKNSMDRCSCRKCVIERTYDLLQVARNAEKEQGK